MKIDIDKLKLAVEKWGADLVRVEHETLYFTLPGTPVEYRIRDRNNKFIAEVMCSQAFRHMIEYNADGTRSGWQVGYYTDVGWEVTGGGHATVGRGDVPVLAPKIRIPQSKDETEIEFLARALIRRMGIE